MAEGVTPTWATRELPILTAAFKRLDAGAPVVLIGHLREELGLDSPQMRAGLIALATAHPPYIKMQLTGGPNTVGGRITGVSERARVVLGAWPSPSALVEQLVEALTEPANTETEPERQGRLRS